MNFEESLKAQFIGHPHLKISHPAIWLILASDDSPLKRRQVARMEREVIHKLGREGIHWPDLSSVDWLRVVQWIAAILSILLLL